MASPSTVVTAGTRQALRTSTDFGSGDTYRPTKRWCNNVTIQWISGGSLYVTFPRPSGQGAAVVSSTVYDVALSASTPSVTIGPNGDGNSVDMGDVGLDASTSGTAFAHSAVTE